MNAHELFQDYKRLKKQISFWHKIFKRGFEYTFKWSVFLISKGISNVLKDGWFSSVSIITFNGLENQYHERIFFHSMLSTSKQNPLLYSFNRFQSPENLSKETKKICDPVISAFKREWSGTAREKFHELNVKMEKQSVTVDGLISWKEMILISPKCRNKILNFLHDSHLGVDEVKSLFSGLPSIRISR